MKISKIGILGAGNMGGGIAQVAAQSGFQVILSDVSYPLVEKAIKRMGANMDKMIQKGRLTIQEKDGILSRITSGVGVNDFSDVDLIIEAVVEDLEVKKKAFQEFDHICKPEAIIATNTSSMSITELASSTGRAVQVAGMHFFNPPSSMKLVEIIRGYYTSDKTVAIISEVAQRMGKTTVEVKKDTPGFIVTRLLIAQFIEAIRLVEEGVASPEDIDTALKQGLNHPMGPFELQDFTGVDIGYYVMKYFNEEFQDMRWNPPQALKALIRAGRLGKKTGAGWFDYN